MRVLHNVSIANTTPDTGLRQPHALCAALLRDLTPLSLSEFPPPPNPTEIQVRQSARSLKSASAPGPDLMFRRLVRPLALTSINSQAGITKLSALTTFVSRLAKEELPTSTLALLTACNLLSLKRCPDKILLIATVQALRRLTTEALVLKAIQDTAEHLACCIRPGTDSIVHDCWMRSKWCGRRNDCVCVFIETRKALNAVSRQKMVKLLPTRART